ncbi:hypothetical protein H6S82_09605 [Planktothrix sp. FACHB-1355]|uniref:EcsC family protein n=1 Tax=Aerosakkonema funiforme FACHB-1375 TaxID=2949571 RepID=A0A926VBC5_9CYAN|nr:MULTISPECIES: hypothetical protein [Oscillatoriales]MBD2180692.1 hypothetical protein [Aerosakkonema funiforme FACHB-1375]MBD3559114.1 hypothetical protein [Planktothrix sp. FACHB-1355]
MNSKEQQASELNDGLKSPSSTNTPEKSSWFLEFAKMVTEISTAFANTASQTGKVIVDTAVGVGEAIGYTTSQTGKAVVNTASGVGKAICDTTSETGKAVVNTASGVGDTICQTTSQTGKTVVETATAIAQTTAKQTYNLFEQATQKAGETISFVSDNWLLRRLSGVFRLDWLVGAADSVDLAKAEADVRKLQKEYPEESPSQIAHRIMVEKAVYAGGVGLVSSILPGEALLLFALDLATTTKLQAEMIYQIAAAYGLDLKEPARKGEVLAIFGLGLGGSRAVKAGLGILRNVPLAGAAIGASSNAVMLYSLGYAACRFYEAKLNAPTAVTTLADLEIGSDSYLETAIAQQKVMDGILVHAIVASHPEKSWSEILPQLQTFNLSQTSLETIAANIQSPQPLDTLLAQLNRDYAIPLLAQCYRIAQADRVITPAKNELMQRIAEKFDLDLNGIREMVKPQS